MEYVISIIIPVYNAASCILKAFKSLEAQTIGFENLKIIAVDDCSIDNSYEIIQKYAELYNNVVVMQTKENTKSASAPRNLALSKVDTKYIMFLDSDDYYEPDACKQLYEAIEKNDVDIVTGYYREISSDDFSIINERAPSCQLSDKRKEYHFPQDYGIMHEIGRGTRLNSSH